MAEQRERENTVINTNKFQMAGAGVALECALELNFHSIPIIIIYGSATGIQKTQ